MHFMSTYSSTILFSLHLVFEQMCCMSFHKSSARVQNIQIFTHIHTGNTCPAWCLSTMLFSVVCAVCSVSQLCPTLCNPLDCRMPDSSVHGTFPARILRGCHFLLQEIFWTLGSNPFLCLLHFSRFLTTETSWKPQLFATIGNSSILGFNYYL